jgi:hypothetical protein
MYVHTWVCLQLELVSSRCLQAVLNTVCTGFVQHPPVCLQHLFDGSTTEDTASMPDRCATAWLLLHAALLVLCCFWLHRVCATCCVITQWVHYGMVSDRINTRTSMHIPLCFAALIVQLQLHSYLITAACTGFVQQVVESGYRPARSFRPTEHINRVH